MFRFLTWMALILLVNIHGMSDLNAGIPSIRVRVAKSLPEIQIQGTDVQKKLLYREGGGQYTGPKKMTFNCTRLPESVVSRKHPLLLAGLSSPTGLVSWNDNRYRGELVIMSSPGERRCDLVNELPIEEYISSLLAKEMNSAWPIEVLKAQAVAARTYAFYQMNTADPSLGHHVINSEFHQVNGTFFDETITTYKAAKLTGGEILVTKTGQLTPVFYHSKCGGHTIRPERVWGKPVEGYRSVPCPFCKDHGQKDWTYRYSESEFKALVAKAMHRPQLASRPGFMLVPDHDENTSIRVYIDSIPFVVEKSALRKLMGRELWPSNNFTLTRSGRGIEVRGKGNGHGVGMCQFGALELAQRGWNYKQILQYYFPNHKLTLMY